MVALDSTNQEEIIIKKKQVTIRTIRSILILLLVILTATAAGGQYELSWYTIDGGGGQSRGGDFSVIGTIAQPDAAWSSGRDYELLAGFWQGGPLCFVDFEQFARFAQYWMEPGTGSLADLYEDSNNKVNELDLGVFVDQWLCYCPTGWPLK